ncbi:MAG TPA: TraB/GumN family protein [Phycisphaerae bacterium]|nr:TraB/GumN family protein [Phycisphaerae bacterium]
MSGFCRTRKRIHVLLLLVAGVCAAQALAGDEVKDTGKCLLWRVRSGGATVYLLGSLHFGKPALYPLDPTIEKAFAESECLVTEVNLNPANQRKLDQLTSARGVYPAGESLERDVAPDTLRRLKEYLESRGMRLADVSRLRPWLVAMTLMQQETVRAGFRADLGLDKCFLKCAVAAKKPILTLETVESQAGIMADGTREEHELALRHMLDQLPDLGEMMTAVTEAWQAGDAEAIDTLSRRYRSDDGRLAPALKRLRDDRNERMARTIEGFLETDKTYFAVVGCMHLVGEKGIVRLLRSRGSRIEQLDKTGRR